MRARVSRNIQRDAILTVLLVAATASLVVVPTAAGKLVTSGGCAGFLWYNSWKFL